MSCFQDWGIGYVPKFAHITLLIEPCHTSIHRKIKGAVSK